MKRSLILALAIVFLSTLATGIYGDRETFPKKPRSG